MLNVKELEKRWLFYKIEKALPFAIAFVIALLLGLITFVLFFTQTKKEIVTKPQPIIKQVEKKEQLKPIVQQQVVQKKPQPKQEPKKEEQVLELKPSLHFLLETPTTNNTTNNTTKTPKKELPKIQKVEKKEPEKPHKKVVIKHQNTRQDIQDVLQRFNKNNNPILSLFIAKKYYELHQYKEAYNYALITNNINSNIEESWIIFAKSKVKLGRKNEAMRILTNYLKHSNSRVVKNLLYQLKKNK